MKLFFRSKDGGEESHVWGYWLVEIKRLFSVVLLRFEDGSREAYHSHAFNCFSWVLRGRLVEDDMAYPPERVHEASWRPFVTRRSTMHKVTSEGRTWVLSFRGPWCSHWLEYLPDEKRWVRMGHGRVVLAEQAMS